METLKDFLIACVFMGALLGIRYFIMDAVKDAMEDFYRDKIDK